MIVRVTFNIHISYFFLCCNFKLNANKASVIRLHREGKECTWMDSVGKKFISVLNVCINTLWPIKAHIMQNISGFDMAAQVGILQLLILDVNRM